MGIFENISLTEVISAISFGVMGYIATQIKKSNKKAEEDRKEAAKDRELASAAAKLREERDALIADAVIATIDLGVVSANALVGEKNNGNVRIAKDEAIEAKKRLSHWRSAASSKFINYQ